MASATMNRWQAGTDEEVRLVRAFSNQNNGDSPPSNVVRAVGELSREEQESEALRFRQYFNNTSLSSDIEIEKLDVEAGRLKAAIETFQKSGSRVSWDFSSLQSIVKTEKAAWEDKPRWYSGKAQKGFHDVMGKIDAHSNLLSMLPSEDKYFSIVFGAISTLVKASAEHRKTSERINRALMEINDEVQACTTDCELIKSELIKTAIAKLYVAVFLFYADAIEWWVSSSKKKVRYSLHENFSERFNEQLGNIKRLSAHVNRAARAGHGAETSYIRVTFEGLRQDLRAGLEGQQRALQEERHQRQVLAAEQAEWRAERKLLQDSERNAFIQAELWRRIGLGGTSLLHQEARGFIEDKFMVAEDGSANAPKFEALAPDKSIADVVPRPLTPLAQPLNRATLQGLSARLCSYIHRGAPIPDTQPAAHFMADKRTVIALEEWTLFPSSKLLCLEGPYIIPSDSEMSLGAAYIVWTAVDLDFPTVSFFCETDPDYEPARSANEKFSNGYLGLVYSLIHQIICLLPPIIEDSTEIHPGRFTSLSASEQSWHPSLDLLRDLLKTAPPLLLCVIDGLQAFEDSSGSQAAELVSVLRSAMSIKDKVFKVLLTTSGYASTLLPNLQEDEFERINTSGTAGRPGPGKMTLRLA